MPPVDAAQGIPGDEGRVAPSRWKVRRASKVQGAAGNVDLWQADRLRNPISDGEIGGVELGIWRVRAEQPVESESRLVDQIRAEGVRFIEGEELPVDTVSVSETGYRVAEDIRLNALGKVEAVVAVQPVTRIQDVTHVQRPLIVADRPGRPTDQTRRSRGIAEIRAGDQAGEFRSRGISDGRAIRIAEDDTVQTEVLRQTEALIREEEERLASDDGPSEGSPELIAFERRRLMRREVEEVTGVQRVIAHELKEFAVELAASRACCHVDDRSRTLPVFRAQC